MSASSRPTLETLAGDAVPCPASSCSARLRLVATVDLPTPPLPLATAMTCLTPGSAIFWAGCGGILFSKPSRLHRSAQLTQVLQGVETRVVAIAPGYLVGVVTDRRDADRFERH